MIGSETLCEPPSTTVALVDPRRLLRDCVAVLLAKKAPEINVVGVASAAELQLDRVALIVCWLDQPTETALALIDEQVNLVRRRFPATRLAAFVGSKFTDPRILQHAVANGVALIELHGATGEIAIASIRLAIAGGNFAPAEFFRDPKDFFRDPKDLGIDPQSSGANEWTDDRAIAADAVSSLPGITPREMQLLQCLDKGLQNKMIAHHLGISESTVKIHLRNLMRKLNATNRTQVAILGRRLNSRNLRG